MASAAATFASLVSVVIFSGVPTLRIALRRKRKAACGLVSLGSQQEVKDLALFVDGAVQILPLTGHLDIGLVQPPGSTDRAFASSERLMELLRVRHDLSVDRRVVHVDSSLLHDLSRSR